MFILNAAYHSQDQEKLLASEDLERTQVLMLMGIGAADAMFYGGVSEDWDSCDVLRTLKWL